MRKGIWTKVLAILLVAITCLSIVPISTSAATTTPYYLAHGSWYRVNSMSEEEGTGSAPIYDIYMYGDSTSGSGTLYNGAYINWDTVNIYIDTDEKVENIVYCRLERDGDEYYYGHENGTGGHSRTLFSGSLPDGNYNFHVIAWYQTQILIVVFSHEYVFNFDFTVDRTVPTISGASTSTKYTNSAFTVSASDATSGVKTFWYAEPGDEYYKAASSTSVSIPSGSTEGYYHFYATDNAGNKSSYHYVYLDQTNPTGKITNTSGTTLTGTYTNKAFKYVASDGQSGIGRTRVWKPGASEWVDYTGTIYTSQPDGTYYFYAADRAGNQTSQSKITLDSTAPTGTLYGGSTVVANGGSIVADYAKFVPSDATSGVKNIYVKKPGSSSYVAYTSGSYLYTKGTYYFYATDNAGNTSSTYSMTLLDEPAETYIVSYHANGGSGAPASQTKVEDVPLTLSSTRPTRSGYTFLGWGTSSTSTTVSYNPGSSYTRNASITLYAIWDKNPEQYTVYYNANGGSGAPTSQTKVEDVPLTLSSTRPTRSGYSFLGWSESSTASSASYAAGGSYTKNASTTLYAVWLKNTEYYTVSYNATGGTGAPVTQTKTENVDLTLSSAKPTRSGYDFLGWSESSSASSVDYNPGGIYTENASTTLYAVWSEVNYDFSVSNLTVTPNEIRQFESVNVSFRIDSWDRYNPYTNIPIDVLLNGVTVYSTTVDISTYGVKNISFNMNVGANEGNQTLEARVNWDDHYRETRTSNNTTSTNFTVKKVIETSAGSVESTGTYTAGQEVVSSFYVYNEGSSGIIPSDNVSFCFEVYELDANGNKTIIITQTKDNIVIPGNSTNLVYFKWKVPSGSSGRKYYCKGTVSTSDGEQDTSNNTTEFTANIASVTTSQTPNTRYESQAPAGYNSSTPLPQNKTEAATWNEWVYENDEFVLKQYGVQISSVTPVITPSDDCNTAVYENGKWTIGSGYGYTISYAPTVATISGYSAPSSSAYTSVQCVSAVFPEYNYSDTTGNFRTLVYVNGKYQFLENANAYENGRIHFIPVWFSDGNYVLSLTATEVWTPAGMISAVRATNTLNIEGTMYDDYFVGG